MDLLKFENKLMKKGFKVICGVDEVGYGSIAGPIYACAICLDIKKAKDLSVRIKNKLYKINDSKQLPRIVRERLFEMILNCSNAIGIGVVNEVEINRMKNLYQSGFMVRHRAVMNLAYTEGMKHIHWHPCDQNIYYAKKFKTKYTPIVPHCILIDGGFGCPTIKDIPTLSVIDGDCKSISIASASIIAKVLHDEYMNKCDNLFPQYGWKSNVGYKTKHHQEMLKKYGISPLHRYFVKE